MEEARFLAENKASMQYRIVKVQKFYGMKKYSVLKKTRNERHSETIPSIAI